MCTSKFSSTGTNVRFNEKIKICICRQTPYWSQALWSGWPNRLSHWSLAGQCCMLTLGQNRCFKIQKFLSCIIVAFYSPMMHTKRHYMPNFSKLGAGLVPPSHILWFWPGGLENCNIHYTLKKISKLSYSFASRLKLWGMKRWANAIKEPML